MGWLVLTVFAVISRAIYSLGTKILTNRLPVSSPTQSFCLTGTATLLGLLASPFLGWFSFGDLGGRWDTVLLMVVTLTIGNVFYFRAQQELDAGTTQIAFSSIVIWGTLLSVALLGSHFSPKQGIGIIILIAAIILIQYRKGHRKVNAAVLGIVASAASFAAFQVTSAQIAPHATPATYLLLAYGGTTLLLGLVYAKRIRREAPKLLTNSLRFTLEGVVFAATGTWAYFIFAYYAYRQAPDAGVVVVLLTTQVVFSIILATIFLRERQHLPRKALATAMAFAASVLIKS
jgi:drug/metabolite transporter (DMT)-like permease